MVRKISHGAVLFVFTLIALSGVMTFIPVLPSPEWLSLAFPSTFLLTAIMLWRAIENTRNKDDVNGLKKLISQIAFGVIVFGVFWFALATGVPALSKPFMVTEYEKTVTITRLRLAKGGRRDCHGAKVSYLEQSSYFSHQGCYPEALLATLSEGTLALVGGRRNWFGWTVEWFKKAPIHENIK